MNFANGAHTRRLCRLAGRSNRVRMDACETRPHLAGSGKCEFRDSVNSGTDLSDASLQNHARPLGHGQMMFSKYIVVVDHDGDMHNPSDVLFRLCANTDPQRDSIVLDHATSEIAIGTKLGIDATRKLAGEGFNPNPAVQLEPELVNHGWPRMNPARRRRNHSLAAIGWRRGPGSTAIEIRNVESASRLLPLPSGRERVGERGIHCGWTPP